MKRPGKPGSAACLDGQAYTLQQMLGDARWAQELTAEEFRLAAGGVSERRFACGQFVCRKGDPVRHWYGVIEGLVKLSSDCHNGKTATLGGASSGGWFGEGSLLKAEPRRFDVVALRDCRIACMQRKTFEHLVRNSIGFNRFLINQLNERLCLIIGQLESERLTDTDARVARAIVGMFHPLQSPNDKRHLAISQLELAHLAGISRQRVNRSLNALKNAGLVTLGYGGVTILDFDGLRHFGGLSAARP